MKPKIRISLEGGLVGQVAANLPRCQIVVVDFDLDAQEDWPVLVSPPREQDETFRDGKATCCSMPTAFTNVMQATN